MGFMDILEKANKAASFVMPNPTDPAKMFKEKAEAKAEELVEQRSEEKMQNPQMNAADAAEHDASVSQSKFQSGFDSMSGGGVGAEQPSGGQSFASGVGTSFSQALNHDSAVAQNRFSRAFQSMEDSDFSGISAGGADVEGVALSGGGRLDGVSGLSDEDKSKTATQSGPEMEV